MPVPTPAVPTSPLASILGWSATWPAWQRDALRRIVGSGPLSADALKELAAICRAKHGLTAATGTAPSPDPLSADHTHGVADGTIFVSLSKLSGLQNVGRIPSDQEIVFGAAPGLTVIYGENGAGKSGYARVIKKACRARGMPQDIKPDAFATAAAGPAKARITFRAGAAELPFDWQDGVASDQRLGNIFVFDSFSARVHVGEDGPACFKPRGLDVLPELAKACDTIKTDLQAEIDADYKTIREARDGWSRNGATAVAKLVNAIDANTDPATIEAVAAFTDKDEKRLTEIIATLSTDPKIKAADTTAAAKRIRTFAETAQSRATSVDETAMQSLGEAIKDAETTAKAAKVAAGPELKDGDLPGSCNDVWRRLWDAAQAFSVAHAYPDKQFPVTEADAKCVLCQQTLQLDAIDRYDRFNNFVADETRKQADAAKAKVADLKKGVDPLLAVGTEAGGIEADLDREAAGTFAAIEAFAKAVNARITHAQTCLQDGTWTDAPALPASPCAAMVTLADGLDKRAKEEEAAADPKKKQELEKERDELTDKKWLASKKDDVKAQIGRYTHAAKLKDCQDDCIKNTITLKSGELEKTYVTQKFHDAFKEELKGLGMTHARVQLEEARPEPGTRRHGLRLEGSPRKANGDPVYNPKDVLSEGEQRCAALAAFMAELSQASHNSALVFGDPVSSLDHTRRDAIAARWVTAAAHRPVLVFTHVLAFVCDLDSAARAASGHIHYQHIEWLAGKPGRVLPGLVWDAQSFKEQMKTLNEQVGHADSVYKTKGDSEYRDAAMPVVGRVRGACERIIEQHMLNGVIKRHDSRIDVKNTPSLAAVTADQWKVVRAIWKDCSNIIEAHATPLSGPVNIPTPDHMKEWMKALEVTVEDVKKARESGGSASVSEPKPATSPVAR